MRFPNRIAKPLALAIAVCNAMPAFANPVNPTVVRGTANFAQSGGALTVTNSANAIINWQGFSIGSGELTRFVQPSAASAVLNRVTGQDPSQILGQLQSNGRVLLINPNGILFGRDARVDVAGLIASTLNLANDDFLAGRYRFAGDGANGVVNQGTISTPMGGNVYLVGGSVRNEGLITSPKGEVILAAGQSVSLVDTATPNVKVEISAPAGEAVNLGSIIAGGGSIDIHAATVNQQGMINADALARDDQGRIRLIASGTMTVGTTSVTSAANHAGGDGGFIETSGAHVQIEDGAKVSTAAPQGRSGTWLIDPVDFTIAASGGDFTGTALSGLLASNSVTIQTATGTNTATNLFGTTGTLGDINVNDPVSWSANTVLTLSASRNLNVNSNITATGNTAGLVLLCTASCSVTHYNLNNGASITLSGSNPSLAIAGNPYTVINGIGVAGDASTTTLQGMKNGLAGRYALGSNIDASATSTWNSNGSGGFFGFLPVGDGVTNFTGTLDGLGHAVTGLTINRPLTDRGGLFGTTNGATIRNVGLVGGSVTGRDYVGGLVGLSNTDTIINSYNTGTVSSISSVGNVGGLVGYSLSTIIKSYSTGAVNLSGSGSNAGGLVGILASGSSSIEFSYSSSTVSGTDSVGGLAGNSNGNIRNSYSIGTVSGTGTNIGGLVGGNAGSILNSYSAGSVTGITNVGGLLGVNFGPVTNSYWDTQTSGRATSAAGTGYTTAQMKQQANFTGWDFATGLIWTITNGVTYPQLVAFIVPLTVTASAANKVYDGLPFSGGNGVTYLGFTGGDNALNLGGALAFGGTSQGAINTGSFTIVPSGYSSTKYTISYVNGTLTISPAPLTVTANSATKTFDGIPFSGGNGASFSGFVNGETATVLGGTLGFGGTSQGALAAGTYIIVPSGLTSSNYSISFANGALSISGAALSLVAAASITGSGAGLAPGTLDRLPDFLVQPLHKGGDAASVTTGNLLATGHRSFAEPVLDVLQSCQP